ncbi:peptidase S41 [Myroides sp. 1354]|uniref:S41 family peptidase n=1 Tax=unclassified Myroides TaxID=2642485 RepID=UPI002575A137|nr:MULTISPECIES: S41 family peptidase [unclassified Myroides]MDM1044622.1 peptidase S41 [Myroides sp. R163-1]MDM1055335.1 peptidase S41 [Myroides sp. 1354]MDM1068632.1 peptidase S41 [Myroides sp. 1372]
MKIDKTILFICLLFSLFGFSQNPSKEITKDEYLADFDFMVRIIKEQHPNPFRFITEKTFDNEAAILRKKLENDPTYINFHRFNPLTLIRDAHVNLVPDAFVFESVTKTMRFFPFATTVYDNRVFVNQYTKAIPIGAEIISVNQQPVNDILAQVADRVDGDIVASTQKNFSLAVSCQFPTAEFFTLTYKEGSSKQVKSIRVKSVNYEKYDYNNNKTVLPFTLLAYTSGIYGYELDENTYILSIKSFNLSEEYAYYILNNLFTSIKEKGIKYLVLDLRDNLGGSLSNIPLFYSFISREKNFKNIYKYATKVPSINVKENLVDDNNKLANASDIISLNNFMKQRFDLNEADGFYYGNNRLDEYYVENYPQDKNAFTGEVVLLQNNNTVSAAAYFTYMFQINQRGLIVGQETGSCSNFTTAAWFLNYKLPHTESIVALPRSELFFNTTANKDCTCRGVRPDYSITADQFQEGLQAIEDAEMNLALRLIKK